MFWFILLFEFRFGLVFVILCFGSWGFVRFLLPWCSFTGGAYVVVIGFCFVIWFYCLCLAV